MRQWERRLKDLAHLLGTCAQTYFDPDLFRMNVNQFLQTSRTVTFIIQKHKAEIPNFDSWYATNIEAPWRIDPLMLWAKNSRNIIEKQGDLELHSSLKTTLLFSYLQEEDISIECGRQELAGANVKRLIRFARSKLPTGVADAAAVKIERRWVAASLSNWELLHALGTVYGEAFRCCSLLAEQLGDQIDEGVPRPAHFAQVREEARQVRYVKLRGLDTIAIEVEKTVADADFAADEKFASIFKEAKSNNTMPRSLTEAVMFYGRLAKTSFEHYGSHVPIALVFDSNWNCIDILSTHFSDTTDKYIFWRTVAERLDAKRAYGLVWIAESWLRDPEHFGNVAIRNMPIVGERLVVLGFDKTGAIVQVGWNISRPFQGGPPTLMPDTREDQLDRESMPMFFVPAMRALNVYGRSVKPRSAG